MLDLTRGHRIAVAKPASIAVQATGKPIRRFRYGFSQRQIAKHRARMMGDGVLDRLNASATVKAQEAMAAARGPDMGSDSPMKSFMGDSI